MKWLSAVSALLTRIKQRRLWPLIIFSAAGACVIAGWVYWPAALHPYLRVPNPSFSLSVPCVPTSIRLELLTKYATLRRAQLLVMEPTTRAVHAQYALGAGDKRTDSGITFTLVTSPTQIKQANDAIAQLKAPASLVVSLVFARIPSIDVESVALDYPPGGTSTVCRPETLEPADLLKRIDDPDALVRRYTLIQEKLSNIILAANEFVGNIMLGVLALMVLWLVVKLTDNLRRVYVVLDKKISSEMNQWIAADAPERSKKLAELVQADYARTYTNLAFLRVFGPATGFVLTVSSLIAGLHPSATAAQDTFKFVSSLQLALVATFMGLLVRIGAELVLRFYRHLAERRLEIIAASEMHS